jgi:hypothetical protein
MKSFLTLGLCTVASLVIYQSSSHAQTRPSILEGRYWIGGTDEGLEVQGNRYRYYSEGGEQEWRSTKALRAIKAGVVFDGKVYWCLSTMKEKRGQLACSEKGWQGSTTSNNPAKQAITDFIPQGWEIEKEVSGDLNNDGKADRVLQIAEVGDSGARPRSLLILKATTSGWETIATAPKLLLCSGCAGMLGGPKGQHIRLTIENGVLIVNQLAGSRSAIAMTHRLWIDRASQKVVLIGEDLRPYDRANGNEIIDSRNFLTGKQIVKEYQGQRKGQKKLIRTQTLKVSRDLMAIESVDIEAARRSAPDLPSDYQTLGQGTSVAMNRSTESKEPTIAQAQPPAALKIPALQKEMSYEAARQLIINAGWQPLVTKNDNPQDGTKSWRDRGYNEVEACSGTGMGFCRFEFTGSDNEKLVVVTGGRQSTVQKWWKETTDRTDKVNQPNLVKTSNLPFVGKRFFNFLGGSGTGYTITIESNGNTIIQHHGTMNSSTLYQGPFQETMEGITIKDGYASTCDQPEPNSEGESAPCKTKLYE